MVKVTSKDVARKAGVSPSVVSAVLNGTKGIRISSARRKAVLAVIEEMNYKVDAQARGLRLGRTHCIAVTGHLQTPFLFQMMKGAQMACWEHGYHLILYGSEHSEVGRGGILDLYAERRIDGILTQDNTSYNDARWASQIMERGIPYVSLEGYPETRSVTSIMTDYAYSIELALDHMYAKSRVAPVYLEIYMGPSYNPNWGDVQRLQAYKNWMIAHKFEPLVISREESSWQEERSRWLHWLSMQTLPLSILSNWSRGAVQVYRAAYELNLLVGKQVFVMAADNTEGVNEHLVPSLSSIEVPYAEMGYAAAVRLIDYIEGKRDRSERSQIILSPKLIMGESV